MKKQVRNTLGFCFFVLFFITGCRQIDLYEKNTAIPNYSWSASFIPQGSFEIKDSSSYFNIYVVLRHTDTYKYNNIWLNVGLQSPGDTMYYQKVELTLGSDAEGWEGVGMNDIWEVRKPLTDRPRRFVKPGTYHYSIQQIMRDDPLLHVMSVGLRIQKMN
ncbi:MAG: gliding motility lipoprotein GldH [Niastella sp.]|nr:gliding motility lipoprotein GldH [Niastella sp.]